MNNRMDVLRYRNNGLMVPRIWVTVALSILVHIVALWGPSPPEIRLLPGSGDMPDTPASLSLRLMPPAPVPPSVSTAPSLPAPAPQVARPKAAPRHKPAPPVIALKQPKPDTPAPAVTAPSVPPPSPAPTGDLASYIEAQRKARGAPAPAAPTPGEDDDARRKRIVAGNIGAEQNRSFGYDPNQGGGVFQITRINLDYAEFVFYGWNRDIRRNTKQVIEIQRGNTSDIRLAVVRRMVAIILEYEQEEFLWMSQRLGRSLMLSARPRDRAGLEEFMMRDFFPNATPTQR